MRKHHRKKNVAKTSKVQWITILFRLIKENALTMVLFLLFAICIFGQSFAGWRLQNEVLAAHKIASISYWHNLSTGSFIEGLASNWQAAVLQLGVLIVFSEFLFQRGAPHSRNPHSTQRKKRRRIDSHFSWIWRHSLISAFILLFMIAMMLHIVFGAKAWNAQRALTGQSPVSIISYLFSASFWSSTLQCWQAEFLALAIYIVLSIFLREQNSAESKKVEDNNKSTGEANR